MATALKGARVARGATRAESLEIVVSGGKIVPPGRFEAALDLRGYLILPGLINAHDHLEFNLFPRLGRGPYPNATAWARDVYRPAESPVREHRLVPKDVRLFWGGVKNLVSGVTTVCHHNPYARGVFSSRFPVRVLRDFGWAHSLAFSPDLRRRYRRNPPHRPFIFHAGEATDAAGRQEIAALERMGVLPGAVLVHAVALDREGLQRIRTRGASLIACPVSNLFTLGRTMKRAAFSSGIPIALGTDSAMTATGDILETLRVARREFGLAPERLYRMVTDEAAGVLRLKRGEGALHPGAIADLIAIRDPGGTPADALLGARKVEMVMIGGRIRLLSERLARRLGAPPQFEPLRVAGRGRVLVDSPVADMYRQASAVLGTLRLAGKAVSI